MLGVLLGDEDRAGIDHGRQRLALNQFDDAFDADGPRYIAGANLAVDGGYAA